MELNSILRVLVIGAALCCPYLPVVGQNDGGTNSTPSPTDYNNTAFIVSGGQLSAPFYSITFESNGSVVDFQNYLLTKGNSYVFKAGNISSSHPFNIGESHNISSQHANGGPLDQNSANNGQNITVTIPADFSGTLAYFCTIHSSMLVQFSFKEPADTIGASTDTGTGDSNSFSLDTTSSGPGGDTGTGDSNSFALDTTSSGPGGDTGTGDSNTFALDTTSTGPGGDTGTGDSNSFTLDTTSSGPGGDTGTGDSNSFTLDTTSSGPGGDTGTGDSNAFTLDTTSSGPGGDTGTGDSNSFTLDTTSSGPGGDTGTGDSNSFTLDTTSSGPGGDTGTGDSNAFTLDTTSSGPGGDTGTGDSNSFVLDTTSSGPGGDTGTGDSNSFSLNTTSSGPGGDTGTGDSNTFALDTTSTGPGGDTGTGDSNSFGLDTTSSGPGGDTGTGDSNSFALDTTNRDTLANTAPQFQTDGNLSVLENEAFVFDFNATDTDNDNLSYKIEYGDDSQLFEINATSGNLSFTTTRDYENAEDSNSDNVYELTVSVSDGSEDTLLNVFVRVLDQSYEPSRSNHFVESASGLEMIWVEAGTFTMGSPSSESARSEDETQHEVTISEGFYLSKFEVTQAQYQAVMEGNTDGLSATPSQAVGPNRPVEMVSWSDLQLFISRLNEIEQTAGRLQEGESYGLPTEAQWEYACRAGTTTRYSWGEEFDTSNANYTGTNIGTTVDVGSYDPNPWGFYDMHGNVWEFCADWYGTYDSGSATDPTGPSDGTVRIKRGGSYVKASGFMRSATRASEGLSKRAGGVGFRLAFYPSMEADSNNDNTSSNDTGSGDSNTFSLDTTETGSGGDTGSGDSNTFALDTTDSGTGGDTGSGDSNTFSLDTTETGSGGDTGSGDSNTFALDTTDSGTGGDTGSGDSNTFSLDTTETGSGGDTGSGDSNTFTLDTTDSETGGDTGSGDSNTFSLDTTDTGSGGDTGSGDSNTFTLDTTDSGTGGDTGSGDSNSFSLDTTDSGSEGDTGSGDSNTFTLDTTDSGTGGDTGHGDSNSFSLDTKDTGSGGDTGSGDSNTFTLNTTDSGTGGDTGHGDSNSFSLDTTDTGSGGDTGSGDSNTFSLDTTDSGTGGDTGSGDSNSFSLDTTDTGSVGDTGSGDSNTFALDTTEESQSESIPAVWDANDQVLVFQVSDEYIWNPELNAVTLWSVDESGGDIQALTMRFENGRNFGQEGFHDLIELPQPYDMPFVIDGNGYIKVTEENGYQYYHVTSIENGIIATLEGSENDIVDNGTNSVDQWFFTSRSSAEEFYFSKLGSKNNTEDEIGLGDSNYFSLDTTNNDADPVMGMGESNIFSLDTTDPNQAPIIHSDDYIGVPENESFVLEVNASDPNEDQIITYSITGGADQELFVINTITGDLKFSSPPNFEEPKDSKLDNVYEVTVSVSDGELEINLNLSIVVLDVKENQAPTDLTLSSSSVLENLPANTKVGRLETIDPNPGDSFSYTILENSYQEEEKNENLFRLDGNGTIVTTRTLDFESDPIFTLLEIRTEDQNGAAFTKTFEIELLNVVEDLDQDGVEDAHDEDRDGDGFSNEEEIANGTDPDNQYSLTKNPIVSVFDAMEEENGSLTLNGMVDFDGGGKIFDFGFVLSSRITLNPENSEVYWIRGTGSAAEFTLSVDAHPFSDHYYFRAWARNAAGYGISSVRKIIVEEEPQLWWGNITEHDGGWMSSDWFGTFRYYEKGWMFHSELGWLFTSPDQKDGVWIWTAAHNWLWTQAGIWPYLFKNDTLDWLYYTSRGNGNGIFYDFSTSSYDSSKEQEANTSQSEDSEQ